MTAETTVRKRATAPTVEQLEEQLRGLEREFIEYGRAENVARTALPGLIAQGDAEEIANCRKEITTAAAKAKQASEAVAATEAAIVIARERDHKEANANAYRSLKQLIAQERASLVRLADAIVELAVALWEARTGIDSVDALCRRSGVMPDPYIVKAKIVPTAEIALHLETRGVLGVGRTLENPHQLRESGRADLKKLAAEFEQLYLRQVRTTLGVNRESEF